MKKLFSMLCVVLMVCMLWGCSGGQEGAQGGSETLTNQAPKVLIGEWGCLNEYEGCESDYGYYLIRVEEDGEFSMYDVAAGNPGIAGTMATADVDAAEGVITVSCDDEDFDPPAMWDMELQDDIEYAQIDENTIKLGRNGHWLAFSKESEVE